MAEGTRIDEMLEIKPRTIIAGRNDQVHIRVTDAVAVQSLQHPEKYNLAGAAMWPIASAGRCRRRAPRTECRSCEGNNRYQKKKYVPKPNRVHMKSDAAEPILFVKEV